MKGLPRELAAAAVWPLGLQSLLALAICLWWASQPAWVPLAAFNAAVLVLVVAWLVARASSVLQRDLEALRALANGNPKAVVQVTPASLEAVPVTRALTGLLAQEQAQQAMEVSARTQVQQAQQLRVRFVASMGHDLRSPLNAIIGFADLLVLDASDPVRPEQRNSVEIIRRSTRDLLALLDDILDWAKLESGRLHLERSDTPLSELLTQTAELAKERSAGRGLRVALALQPGLPTLAIDRQRVSQALLGLLGHAIRAGEGPSVRLAAQVQRQPSGDDIVVIEVHDPSLVVREADHRDFFQAFRPSFAPSGRRIAGLGVGTALARALFRAHGGDVWFDSRPDRGTSFTLSLPVETEKE